jgi:hypothetical protein
MAKKKKQASKPSAAKARKPAKKAAKKAAKKPARKQHQVKHRHDEHHHDDDSDVVEIELSESEQSMVDKILDSDELCQELETEAIAALSGIVQKFFGKHGTTLTDTQAQNVAMVLFGD